MVGSDMKNGLILLGLLLMVVGVYVASVMPYDIVSSTTYRDPYSNRLQTIESTVTFYGHPSGYAIGGVGFLSLLIGLVVKTDEKDDTSSKGSDMWVKS